MAAGVTPSQTIGPFFHDALLDRDYSKLVAEDHPEAITLVGTVFDGAGDPVPDAMVEVWQAHPSGRFAHPEDGREELPLEEGFEGFGRSGTQDGGFRFVTLKPGPVPGEREDEEQAPHLAVSVFARGLLKRVVTRVYFPDERERNANDPVLRSIGDERLRETLIATAERDGVYRFDVHLQGERQTAFFGF